MISIRHIFHICALEKVWMIVFLYSIICDFQRIIIVKPIVAVKKVRVFTLNRIVYPGVPGSSCIALLL